MKPATGQVASGPPPFGDGTEDENLPSEYRRRRLGALRREMASAGIDLFVVSNLKNIYYLSGFSGSFGVAVITSRRAILITDFRYRIQVAGEVRDFKILEQKGPQETFLRSVLGDLPAKNPAFETSIPWAFAYRLRRASGRRAWRPVEGLVEKIRLRKDPWELRLIERGIDISIKGSYDFFRDLKPGLTERDSALELECGLRRAGSDELPFPPIVAAGRNGAMPHARPGKEHIKRNDTIVCDFGSSVGGYATDMTRTFCLGRPKKALVNAYRVVYDAQSAALASVAPGVSAGEVDEAARAVIRRAGYGDCFGHSTGHGIGLDVHEGPTIFPDGKEILAPGMVFTIEPGIYLQGVGGVRIEDMVLITPDGHRVLTAGLPKSASLGSPAGSPRCRRRR